jgi:cytochrome c biogenesis protein CcmG/thiol:disulfide interchange protein DsbE
VTTVIVLGIAAVLRPSPPGETPGVARGQTAPAIVGTTLEGASFDLASLRGRPVIVNFWGPSCVPCRDEFPLFKSKLAAYGPANLAVVGVLMLDGPDAARTFAAQYGAPWPTVEDPAGLARTAYRVVARPQSYFIDREGIVREISVGQVTDHRFECLYASISGVAAAASCSP